MKVRCRLRFWKDVGYYGQCSKKATENGLCAMHQPEAIEIRERKKRRKKKAQCDSMHMCRINNAPRSVRLCWERTEEYVKDRRCVGFLKAGCPRNEDPQPETQSEPGGS